ncbi:hypothetical protein LTR17_004880 [Elasticomyces elasticus]|nr:hypothetical protein LTR17_004880 [Elasticomyces elasticus]
MSPTVVLVSGANRGLGKGLVQLYLARSDHTVIAANRDPGSSSSKALSELPTGASSRLIVVKVDASAETDAVEAVKILITKHGIDHIDIVVANAGVSYTWPSVATLKVSDLQAHIEPNVYGCVWLYQATAPLLRKAATPRFINMGSTAGGLVDMLPIPNAAYGPSKAASHWLTKRMDAEEEKLAAFVISPGWVQTELGNAGAEYFGMKEAAVTVKDSCKGTVALIEKATKATHGGKIWGHEGDALTW